MGVAVEVMGWTKHEYRPIPLLGTDLHWRHADGTRVERWHTQAAYGDDKCRPFSTDWAAAGEVLEKLKSMGIYLGVWPVPDGWDVENYEGGVDWVEGISTGPLAICLAALEAVK